MRPALLLSLAFGAWLLLTPAAADASGRCPSVREDCHFTILTPRFESPESGKLGANVALALQHQIFRTFLIDIPAEPENLCCFPRDTIAVLDFPLPELSQAAAEARGRGSWPASMVLWGKAWPWREYVVVQPYLSVIGPPEGLDPRVRVCCTNTPGIKRQRPFTREGGWRIWELSARDADGNPLTLSIDRFPRDLYDLPQISLDADEVTLFNSLAGLPVHDGINGNVRPGIETSNVIEATQHVGAWTKITNPRGWVKLPKVDAGPTVDFIGGLFYFLRGNWERAQSSFELVARNESANSSIRVDSALLWAATAYRLDPACTGCEEAIGIAAAINPYSQITARYQLMSDIARASQAGDYSRLLDRINEQKARFPAADPFTQRALSFLAEARMDDQR